MATTSESTKVVWRIIETAPQTYQVHRNGKLSSTWFYSKKGKELIENFAVLEKLKGNDVGVAWWGAKNK